MRYYIIWRDSANIYADTIYINFVIIRADLLWGIWKMRKRIAAAILVLSLIFSGSGCFENKPAASSSTGTIADVKYKELTGNVVVFGTSIWAIEPGPTGIASSLEQMTSFKVTDFSMLGGLCTRIESDSFNDISLVSILLYNKDKYSKNMRDAVSKADYVLLAFGGNDHSQGIPASGEGESYENALKISVSAIRDLNPNVRIVLIGPLNGWTLIDGKYVPETEIDDGGGKLGNYIDATERVAKDNGLLCVKMSDAIVFTQDEPKKFFADGSHLTETGRRMYAEYLAEKMYGSFVGSNPQSASGAASEASSDHS